MWIGNVERELGISLTGSSELCSRRRDRVLSLAKHWGVELRDGFNEDIPTKGSMHWIQAHKDETLKQIDEFLAQPPFATFRPPAKEDLLSIHNQSTETTLEFGGRMGGIVFPTMKMTLHDGQFRNFVRSGLQHTGTQLLSALKTRINEAVHHCINALKITESIWRKMAETVEQFASEAKVDTRSKNGEVQFLRTVHILYYLMFGRSCRLEAGELVVDTGKIMSTDGHEHPWEGFLRLAYKYRLLVSFQESEDDSCTMKLEPIFDVGSTLNRSALDDWIRKFNNLVDSSDLRGMLAESLKELQLSEEHLDGFLSESRKLREEWKRNGLSGECDDCR